MDWSFLPPPPRWALPPKAAEGEELHGGNVLQQCNSNAPSDGDNLKRRTGDNATEEAWFGKQQKRSQTDNGNGERAKVIRKFYPKPPSIPPNSAHRKALHQRRQAKIKSRQQWDSASGMQSRGRQRRQLESSDEDAYESIPRFNVFMSREVKQVPRPSSSSRSVVCSVGPMQSTTVDAVPSSLLVHAPSCEAGEGTEGSAVDRRDDDSESDSIAELVYRVRGGSRIHCTVAASRGSPRKVVREKENAGKNPYLS